MAIRYKTRILHKIDTEENWKLNNPILKIGEIGFTRDGKYKNWFKLGDGTSSWNELKYAYSEFLANLVNVDNLTIEFDTNGKISIKDTGAVSGTYGNEYDQENNIFTIPSFSVNSKGQITSIEDKRVQIKQSMNVIPVVGEYTVSSNYTLYAGKSTVDVNCIINLPSMPIGTQIVIKNIGEKGESGYPIMIHPDNVFIDGEKSTSDPSKPVDIILAPKEYITLVSISSTDWSIISESSRFEKASLSSMALKNDIIVRTENSGNVDNNLSTLSLNNNNIATV